YLPSGSILHWEFNHFVVFDRVVKNGVRVVDPSLGPRTVAFDQLRQSFTGVALVFEATDTFEPERRGKNRFDWYVRQLAGQRHVLTRVVVMSVLLRVFALALPLVTALVVDRVVPRSDTSLLMVVAAGLAGMLVFQMITQLVRSHLLLQLRTNLDTRLTLGFVDYLTRLPFQFFQSRSAGDLMMRVNSNATVRELLTSNTLSALLDGLLVIGYAILILVIAPTIGAVVITLGGLQITVFVLARRNYRALMARSLEAQARSQSYLVEMFSGMETLRASAAEARSVEHWSNLYVDELNTSLDRGRLQARVDAVSGLVVMASPLIILVLGAIRVADGSLTLGEMLAVNALAVGLMAPLATMVNSAFQLLLMSGHMDRIDDVLRVDPEQTGRDVARAPKLSGRITLQNVSFRYSNKAPFVVRGVSVDVRPGMMVAVVGSSGCGKSTLARILAGLFRPSEGHVIFDGHDVVRLELKSLRRQIGVVFQSPSLFAGTIRNAIALCMPSATLDRIEEAARAAVIHDDVMALPMGYDTLLTQAGASLSGGQRQRIAIARALVHKPAILILDEATSALDAMTERHVMDNLAKLRCTRIVLAHRLSTIVNADLILVMDGGEIVESGTHHELLARGGSYSQLIAAQLMPDRQRGAA
ncbi:MAG TPA: peptidase domain-containing ABC transporter, partial [Kofleriaceae bacterium]